jgi:anaerobic ribonucleoside-triphosphate reductase activating protein
MLIHATLAASRANGPGIRSVIWTQGCTLGCPGCWNPQTHPTDTGREVSPEDLAAEIIRAAPALVEGVTISGGEPMQQAYHLLELLVHIRHRRPDWSIGLFSGYSALELQDGHYLTGHAPAVDIPTARHLWERIRRYLDFAVLGRYDATRPAGGPLCSSDNQRLHLFSFRYKLSDFTTVYEATIAPDGLTHITGFPASQVLHKPHKPATEGRTT